MSALLFSIALQATAAILPRPLPPTAPPTAPTTGRPAAEDQVVCRSEATRGRIQIGRVCRTQREWRELEVRAGDMMRTTRFRPDCTLGMGGCE